MSKKPYNSPEYWRDLQEIVVLQEFLDIQMEYQFSGNNKEIDIYNPKTAKSETIQIPIRVKVKNKITWRLKFYDLDTADKEYWKKRIAFTKKYPKCEASYLDDIKYENLPHKHIRVLSLAIDDESYEHIRYNGKDIYLQCEQGKYLCHVHQRYLSSGDKVFHSGDVMSRLSEKVFKYDKIYNLFDQDAIMNNLIKSVGDNNPLYRLDVDF